MAAHSRLALLFFLSFACSRALAIQLVDFPVTSGRTGTAIIYPNGQVVPWPDRIVRPERSGGGVVVSDRVPVNTSRGAITVTARSSVNARAIARGAAIAGRALPATAIAVGVGSVVWELLDDNRIRPDGQGGLMHDPGIPPAQRETLCWFHPGTTKCALTASKSAQALLGVLNSNFPQCSHSLVSLVVSGTTATALVQSTCSSPTHGSSSSQTPYALAGSPNSHRLCVSPVDGSDTFPDRDGQCPTGSYDRPLSDDNVVDIVARDVTDKKDNVPLVNDILATPGGAVDIAPGSTTTSGPSSQTGTPPAPLVTTGPGGSVTRTESPEIAIRYRGNEIEWEPQQVTTRRPGPNPGDPDDVTVTDAPDEPSSDPGAAPTRDPCIDNPKRAGCAELGDVDSPDWDPTEKQIELNAESPWGSDSASCPPPRIITLGGRQYSWEWTLVCDFFSGVRFAVIASAWIAAVMIFLGARTDT
jgi:hypothetical protein